MTKKLLKIILLIFFPLGLFFVMFGLIFLQVFYLGEKNNKNFSLNVENNNIVSDEKYQNNKDFLPLAESNNDLNFLFFGDLMLDRNVKKILGTSNPEILFSKLQESGIFLNRDLISANLEGAVIKNGEHYSPVNLYDFSFSPEDVGALKKVGFVFFNLANNHLSDQGEKGIAETEKNLTDLDFSFSGCRDTMIDSCTSVVVERRGKKIALVGVSMVYGNFNEEDFLQKISELASTSDLLVAQIHWGVEYQHEPAANQIKLAHRVIEAGADVIIGHHPHVVSGVEIYQGKAIFYSLGNFVFDQYFSSDTQEELGVSFLFKNEKTEISLLPIKSERSFLRLMNEVEKNNFLKKMAKWSIGDENFKKQIIEGKIELNNSNLEN